MTVKLDSTCGGLEDKIYAKSKPLITLDEHVDDCMLVMKLIKKTLPYVAEITQYGEKVWELLFLSIFFHDIGKAVKGYQNMIKTGKRYRFRHERLSAAVFDCLFKERINNEIVDVLTRAILTHHKTAEQLKNLLIEEITADEDFEECIINFETEKENLMLDSMAEFIKGLGKKAKRYLGKSFRDYSSRLPIINSSDINPINDVLKQQMDTESFFVPSSLNAGIFDELIMWGLTKTCDHMGSAKVKAMPLISYENQKFLKSLNNVYNHQERCWNCQDDILLIAPTGSGKTEAALGWAFNIINNTKHRHIFYILPYTASINAMFNRFNQDIDNKKDFTSENAVVGLVHGKLRQFLASIFDDDNYDEYNVKMLSETFRIVNKPIKVTTPFQILKYMFGVKGFEKGLIELAGAILIYDEIHAYERDIFLKIIWSLDWLKKNFKVKVFITTATLPTFMQNLIAKVLGISEPIKADKWLLKDFTRHRVKIIEGTIENNVDIIKEEIRKDKKVLIICNTVNKAQYMYDKLKEMVNENEISLLHSRFVYRDRNLIEKDLTDENSKVRVLIGTQAIEVSLNIDYDVLFSEPAPLDALLQRFGRINRKREKGICDVNIFTIGGEYDWKIYDPDIVKNTLNVLEEVVKTSNGVIYEESLQNMMDTIYAPWNMEDYNITIMKMDFYKMLEGLLPYREHKMTEDEFFSQFNTIDVLPACFYNEYMKLCSENKFIRAEMLTCQMQKSIKWNKKVKDNLKKITMDWNRKNDLWIANCKYDTKKGLLISEADGIENFL